MMKKQELKEGVAMVLVYLLILGTIAYFVMRPSRESENHFHDDSHAITTG